MHATHRCPACKGEPAKPALAFFNTGEDSAKHYAAEVIMRCRVCNEVGTVSDEVNLRWLNGRAHSAARKQRGESLFNAARRLGVKASELSAYEHGHADLPAPNKPR